MYNKYSFHDYLIFPSLHLSSFFCSETSSGAHDQIGTSVHQRGPEKGFPYRSVWKILDSVLPLCPSSVYFVVPVPIMGPQSFVSVPRVCAVYKVSLFGGSRFHRVDDPLDHQSPFGKNLSHLFRVYVVRGHINGFGGPGRRFDPTTPENWSKIRTADDVRRGRREGRGR